MPNSQLDPQQHEKILLEHLPQVHFVARRIHFRLPPHVPLEDLIHAGIVGLIDAVRKYDPAKSVLLKHYAEFRIRGAILDSLRTVDWSPRALRRQGRRIAQAAARCRARLKRDPSEEEIADDLGIRLETLHQVRARLPGLELGSLQTEAADESGEEEIERCQSKEEDPYHQALRSEMTELLTRALNELPEREREVLILYHFQELAIKEVGHIMKIGESRVSQIHSSALLRLRTRLPKMFDKLCPSKHRAQTGSVNPTAKQISAQALLQKSRYALDRSSQRAVMRKLEVFSGSKCGNAKDRRRGSSTTPDLVSHIKSLLDSFTLDLRLVSAAMRSQPDLETLVMRLARSFALGNARTEFSDLREMLMRDFLELIPIFDPALLSPPGTAPSEH